MTFALDATPLTLTSGGLARYTAELSLALAREYPGDTFVLLSDQRFALPAGAPENLVEPDAAPNSDQRWWLRGVRKAIAATGTQVFHGTNFEVPYLGTTPAILTIHDLSPWRNPEWHAGASRVRTRTPWLLRLRRAACVLTVSNAIRLEIISHFGIPEDQVRAIPLAASELFRPVQITPLGRPYFLFVGTLEPRKNLAALAEAWAQSGLATDIDLLIAGRTRPDFVSLPPTEGIRYLGEVPDHALPDFYSGAMAFVYPTHYEGFGLPVLEAMQCGCPVITSRDPAVTEVSAGAALHAGSVRELTEALRAVAASPELRADLRSKGLSRAANFSWARTAQQTHALYEELAGVRAGARH